MSDLLLSSNKMLLSFLLISDRMPGMTWRKRQIDLADNSRLSTMCLLNSVANLSFSDPLIDLVKTPGLLHVLFVWKELGSEQDVRQWVNEQIETDSGFVALLQACREWRSSSVKGLYYPLTRDGMSNFLDFDQALERLRLIWASSQAQEQRKAAEELLEAARQGAED